jgi:hypothetical protein
LVDELLEPDIQNHTPLLPGNTCFFTVLAWTGSGAWDYVWNTTGLAPQTAPESLTLKQRSVHISLDKLHILSDSDDTSTGEGTFSLTVTQGSNTPIVRSFFAPDFDTGKSIDAPASMKVDIGPEIVTPALNQVLVRVDGHEDDSGFPWLDSDDFASTGGIVGGSPLVFPRGEVKEEVTNQLLSLHCKPITAGEELDAVAEVRYSVSYS